MAKEDRLRQTCKDLQEHFDLLSHKISELRKAYGIETDTGTKFKLEQQIKEAEDERKKTEKQLESFEKQLSAIQAKKLVRFPQYVFTTLSSIYKRGLYRYALMGMVSLILVVILSIVILTVIQKPKQLIPFNTGWIFIGYYDTEDKVYLEGPFANIVFRSTNKRNDVIVPEIGDVLQIRKARRVIIAKFKSDKLKYQLVSPPKIHGILTDDDETGIIIEKGLLVIVRDVTMTNFPDRPYAVWCRVAECDLENEPCRKALFKL